MIVEVTYTGLISDGKYPAIRLIPREDIVLNSRRETGAQIRIAESGGINLCKHTD